MRPAHRTGRTIRLAFLLITLTFGTAAAQTTPVLYWNFDDLAGGSASDLSGNGNTGYLYRGATHTSDVPVQNPGLALSIPNGGLRTGSYLRSSDRSAAVPSTFGNQITLAICAKVQPGPGDVYILNHSDPPSAGRSAFQTAILYNYPVVGKVTFYSSRPNSAFVGDVATTPDDGEWHHYAFTYDGSTLVGYTDGVRQESRSFISHLNADGLGHWYVGAANPEEGGSRVGSYDEVRVYSSALSDEEVAGIASVCAPLPPVVDSDGDGVPDDEDAFPNDPNESADTDGDSVGDNGDMCAATVYDTMELNPNQWALRAGSTNFIQGLTKKGKSSGGAYSIADTRGCSCTDIVAAADLGNGHLKKGCSNSVMADWVAAAQASVKAGAAVLGASAVSDEFVSDLPTDFALDGNYPNPFNPVTTIRFSVPETAQVSLAVYDMMGRRVRSLVNGTVTAGRHEVSFDAQELPSGTYLYRLTTPAGAFNGKMLLVK